MRLSNIALSLTALYGAGGFARGSSLALDFTSGNRTLDPRITFSRTTNATVTGSNGLIQFAPHNLLTFSEQFDNAVWIKQNATVTANSTAAPNGTLTADALIETAVNGQHQFYALPGLAVQTYTRSIYAKANGRTQFQFEQESGGNTRFTLIGEGTALALGSNTASITAVGNGWYRCTSTFTVTAAFGLYTLLYNGTSTSYTGDGVSGIFFWGAQVESNSTATTYNPTTVKNLLGFTEHFDNAAWTKSNSFVQTNLVTNSEAFDNAAWVKVNATITANSTTAPDGTQTADTFIPTVTAGAVSQTGIAKTAASITYTFSFYAKADGFTSLRAFVFGASNANRGDATFDLSNETVSSVASVGSFTNTTATITNANDGWYRCTITTTSDTTTGLAATFRFDGTVNGTSGFFLWGAQLVQGTSAGDYKATYAAAAAVGYTDIYGQPFAQKLVPDATANNHWVFQSVTTTAAPYTATVYMKAGEYSWGLIRLRDVVGDRYAWFNLSTGVVGTVQTNLTASITSVGNGWYRCSATIATAIAGTNPVVIGASNADNTISYTGDGTSGIYIFGAQLSDSASVDPYVYQPVAAPASTAYYGPRFDYDPVTLAPKGLLIEEQRTNLLTYSEQFDNAAWQKVNTTVTTNAAVAPDGTVNADKLIATTTNALHIIEASAASFTSGSLYTASVYAKKGETSFLQITFSSAAIPRKVNFDLNAGVTGTVDAGITASIINVGNGWYRCIATGTSDATGSYRTVFGLITSATAARFEAFAGDGTSGLFIWGAQVELGAFSTSYIPSVASQVTRAADSASIIGNNFARWYNQTIGTVYSEAAVISTQNLAQIATIDDGTTSNLIQIYTSGTNLTNQVNTGGAAQVMNALTVSTVNTYAKNAFAIKADDFASVVNGGAVTLDTSGTVPVGMSRLGIGSRFVGSTSPLNGHIKRIAYYNRRLANTELTAITN
jgi:hypothetical protein